LISIFRYSALLLTVLLNTNAYCDGWSIDNAQSDLGRFSLGFASGIVVHELGHYVVATSKGYKVGRDGLSIVYPGATFTASDQLQVASAGFQMQWLLSEWVLRDSNGKTPEYRLDNFGAGMVCSHIAITLAYLVYLKDHKQGDVAGMAKATRYSNDRIALALTVPGALDTWRLFGNKVPEWVPQLSLIGKGLGMTWIWTY